MLGGAPILDIRTRGNKSRDRKEKYVRVIKDRWRANIND